MKIVHVETGRHFYGGPQQVIWLMQGLSKRGVHSMLVCSSGTVIETVARKVGLPLVAISCRGDADLVFPLRLSSVLRQEKPDLVHCHSRRGGDLLAGWGALMSGMPAIISRRVDSFEAPLVAALRYRPFNKVVAISENIAAVLRKSRVSSQRLEVVRSAVDAGAIKLNAERRQLKEFGIGDDNFSIVVVAQLIKRKGHRVLLNILPDLLALYPRLRIVFFGEGPEEGRLRQLTHKLDVEHVVHFAGYRSDLDDYLAAFDLFVHLAHREGLGVSILKASAAQLPVIAFDIDGCREAVSHLNTGILVPVGDETALCTAIGKLVEKPEFRVQLGLAGRLRMVEDFSVSTMVERYVDIYSEVLNG